MKQNIKQVLLGKKGKNTAVKFSIKVENALPINLSFYDIFVTFRYQTWTEIDQLKNKQ